MKRFGRTGRLRVACPVALFALTFLALTPQWTTAQEALQVDTTLVTMTATVFDRNGIYRANLNPEDFAVFEDGRRQEIAFFSSDETIPVSIGILFDTSGSMVDKMDGVEDAVQHFIDTTRPSDEIFVMRFNDRVRLVSDFTSRRKDLLRAVNRLEARRSTALYEALYEGLLKVQEGQHKKKAIVLITDGNDTSSTIEYRQILDFARKSEVLIYGLGIGHGEGGSFGHLPSRDDDTVDIRVLESFSNPAGGRSYLLEGDHHSGGVDLIDAAVVEISKEFRQQYSIGYYPTNSEQDGTYRSIDVQLRNPSYSIRTRKGYWADGSLTQ